MSELFEIAARKKFRYNTPIGPVTTEDLWDLPLTSARPNRPSLDNIALSLHRGIKTDGDVISFVEEVRPVTSEDEQKLEIVKLVIASKKAEIAEEKEKKAKAAKRQEILEIMNRKQGDELAGKSIEELTAMLNSL